MIEPICSIIIPTFNQTPDFLQAAVASAARQLPCTQVIVVDDGSVPPQREIVERTFAAHAVPHAVLDYTWQENGGVAAALNAGLARVTTDYVQWLSSDDLLHADRTELQLQAHIAAGAEVSYCGYEEGVPLALATWPAVQYPTQAALLAALQRHCFINACTVIWSATALAQVGGFDPFYRHCQDYEMLLRCAERWNFHAYAEPLVRRRLHPGQMIYTLQSEDERRGKAVELARLRERYGARAQVWVPN